VLKFANLLLEANVNKEQDDKYEVRADVSEIELKIGRIYAMVQFEGRDADKAIKCVPHL
jgi:hypothetical protein